MTLRSQEAQLLCSCEQVQMLYAQLVSSDAGPAAPKSGPQSSKGLFPERAVLAK